MSELDLDAMRHALDTARRLGVRRMSIREGDLSMNAVLPELHDDDEFWEEGESPATGPAFKDITAGHVGYMRFADPMPSLGDVIAKGQKVGEIIALGLANEVVSKIDGEVEEVLVGQNEAVEFGQAILRLKVKE